MKKNYLTVIATGLLAIALLLTGCTQVPRNNDSTPEPTATPEPVLYGLHVEEDGTITLNGDPYYGFGTNWHGIFQRYAGNSELNLDVYFEALQGAIPYFRFMCGEFYESGVWRYVYDKEGYFAGIDKVVAMAEKYQIGLIPSLMWNVDVFYKYYDEDPKECLGVEGKKGTLLMQQYTRDIVERYKDSPAIWAWEYGNEGNLAADRNSFSSVQLGNAYRLFAEVVRSIDSYRMVTTGDSSIFECSYALRTTGKWTPNDTAEQRIETLGILNPDPIDCLSSHIYGHADTYQRVELIETDLAIAKSMGKALFVGEFGPGYSEWDTLTGQAMEDNWNDIVDILVADGVQLAASWGFGRWAEQADGTSIELGFHNNIYNNVYQYDRLKALNQQFIAEGKSTAPDYWSKVTNLFYGKAGWELDGSASTNSTNENDMLKDVSILSTGAWEGVSTAKEGTATASRSIITAELSNGTQGKVVKYEVVGESGIATFPNRLLLGQAIKLGQGVTYTLKVTAKFSFPQGTTSFSDGSQAVIKASANENSVEIIADGQWHTYEYTFTTANSLAKSKINIGAFLSSATAPIGTTLLVEGVELFEGTSVK